MKKCLSVLILIGTLCAPVLAQVPGNRVEIVRQVRSGATAEELKTEAGILKVLVRIVCALPQNERAGLHAKPGGENIAFYAPANKNVGVSRVLYPDGSLVKVFIDAGPGGQNGATWAIEEPIDKDRYVPVDCGGQTPPSPPVDSIQAALDAAVARIVELSTQVTQLRQAMENVDRRFENEVNERVAAITGLGQQIEEIKNQPKPVIPTDCYTGIPFLSCGFKYEQK